YDVRVSLVPGVRAFRAARAVPPAQRAACRARGSGDDGGGSAGDGGRLLRRRLPPGDALDASAVFVLAAAVATVVWQVSGRAVTDIPLYRTYGEWMARGLGPSRDLAFEYPAGAAPPLRPPAPSRSSIRPARFPPSSCRRSSRTRSPRTASCSPPRWLLPVRWACSCSP